MDSFDQTHFISPPSSNDAVELKIPLTFFDIFWIQFEHPVRRLLFYKCSSCSKEFFLQTLIPKLTESLSSTLKHYLPVTGNLIYPLNKDSDEKPFIRYKTGDSVPLTISESDENFDDIVKNHSRDADLFYYFVPQMQEPEDEPGYKTIPMIAFRVTLFPGRGFCIGFSNHHSLGDGNSMVGFIKTWASICRLGRDECLTSEEGDARKVSFDRSFIKDPLGLDTVFWKIVREIPLRKQSFPLPTNRLRATYTLHHSDIKRLKDHVLAKKPYLGCVSSFVVAASYAWTCFVKSSDDTNNNAEDVFIFPVDARSRVDPPVPCSYFGNCLSHGIVMIEHRILIEEEGFVTAAESVSNDIKNRINDKDQVLKGAENWFSEGEKLAGKRLLTVSGSPKFDLYEADFGVGKAEKMEVVHIDGEKYSMSLSKSRVSEGGIEIGFSLPKDVIEVLGNVFNDGLRKI